MAPPSCYDWQCDICGGCPLVPSFCALDCTSIIWRSYRLWAVLHFSTVAQLSYWHIPTLVHCDAWINSRLTVCTVPPPSMRAAQFFVRYLGSDFRYLHCHCLIPWVLIGQVRFLEVLLCCVFHCHGSFSNGALNWGPKVSTVWNCKRMTRRCDIYRVK